MYQLMIIEDEEIFRRVLPEIIPWKALGFEIVCVCKNGMEGIAFLESNSNVDVVLTDIRMPLLNGLDFAIEAKIKLPRLKTVLLTAYNDVEYAKKGIEYGVYGYLLKADGEQAIEDFFTRTKKVLDAEREKEILYSSGMVLRNVILSKALYSKGLSKETENCFSITGNGKFYLCVLDLDNKLYLQSTVGETVYDEINIYIQNFIFQLVEVSGKGFVFTTREFVILIKPDHDINMLIQEIKSEISLLNLTYRHKLSDEFTYSCAYTQAAISLSEIPDVYMRAKYNLKRKFYLGGNIIMNNEYNDKEIIYGITSLEENAFCSNFIALIKKNDILGAMHYIKLLEEDAKERQTTNIEEMQLFISRIMLEILNISQTSSVVNNNEVRRNSLIYVRNIWLLDTLQAMLKNLIFFIDEIKPNNPKQNNISAKYINDVIDYINQYYASDITLADIAKQVNLHPFYISRLFSSVKGETFKSYLTHVRIENAKSLLTKPQYKIYEISSMVGYAKPRHFGQIFKELIGVTPIEYRNSFITK